FPEGAFQSCMLDAQQRGCLINQTVSNSSIRIPLNASTTYYFGFDNRGSSSSKQVLISATLVASSVSTLVARDGGMNFAGLGMSLAVREAQKTWYVESYSYFVCDSALFLWQLLRGESRLLRPSRMTVLRLLDKLR